jgi:hypothetical protein
MAASEAATADPVDARLASTLRLAGCVRRAVACLSQLQVAVHLADIGIERGFRLLWGAQHSAVEPCFCGLGRRSRFGDAGTRDREVREAPLQKWPDRLSRDSFVSEDSRCARSALGA